MAMATVMLLASVVLTIGPDDSALAADATGSAVTVKGTGKFSDLEVTVGQTRDLINQVVQINWKGGAPTKPTGEFLVNFLQIMQCWGDDPAGPKRENCQYGGLITNATPVAGSWVRSRQASYDIVDPAETYKRATGQTTQAYVPFSPVTDPTRKIDGSTNEFFDASTTNEIPLGRTRADGTGSEFFEIQTGVEAPGLGCGRPDPATGKPRNCWLAIVPRDDIEVDGSHREPGSANSLVSSPLSATNWANHLSVPLQFQSAGANCPLGSQETRTVGNELMAEAVLRWQPALCQNGGTVYGFSQLPDDGARRELLTGNAGLGFFNEPPETVPADRPLTYAPVALSGLSLAFFVERQPSPIASDEIMKLSGQRFEQMKLNPRLVAKLLTQSYQAAVPGNTEHLGDNPPDLTHDKEFLELNKDWETYADQVMLPDLLLPLPNSDAADMLWTWINNDPDARAFLNGTLDPYGTRVNPHYKNMSLPLPNFPKQDLGCAAVGTQYQTCELDLHPYTNDMHEGGRATSRGDSLARAFTSPGQNGQPPALKKLDRQSPGRRMLMAVVDTAIAQRYNLPTAQLRNAAGEFVGPTDASLTSAYRQLRPGKVPDVLAPNPGVAAKDAYPLSMVTYAAVAPSLVSKTDGQKFADLIRYAVGAGQAPGVQPGQLPFGYAPLPDDLRSQALKAAQTIVDKAGIKIDIATGAGEGVIQNDARQPDPVRGDQQAGAKAPATAPLPVAGKSTAPSTRRLVTASNTPGDPLGLVRWALVVILVLGGAAAAAGPVLSRLGQERGGAGKD
ncbi:hypothetical protein D5S17_18680 [Pseudonocardiaceae bacterium YIM PH 21723]|nr:hypothetical protein D5S17_18680 [Pseudonocardiaceae bacterium YIM PH 21723]